MAVCSEIGTAKYSLTPFTGTTAETAEPELTAEVFKVAHIP
jgi:hypothetical protein